MKKRTLPSCLLLIFGLLLLPTGCVDFGILESEPGSLARVDVSPETATLTAIGATVQFTYVARDSEGNRINARLSWASSNEGVATVDLTGGLATAVANGTTVISASNLSFLGRSGSATLTVAVP